MNSESNTPKNETQPSSSEVGCRELLAYKKLLLDTSIEETIAGDGVFAGMKIKVLTKPLPDGVIGMIGDTPENSRFIYS